MGLLFSSRRYQTSPKVPSLELSWVEEKSEHNPGDFREGLFVNARGLELRAYAACKVQKPRGVIISHHGIRAHGLFELLCPEGPGERQTCIKGSIAELYLDAGFAVYTYDCEGHGRSESQASLGYFNSAWELVGDLVQFAALVRKEHAGLRVFASACSMGGGISVGAAIRDPSAFDGLLLAAPMVSVERVKNRGANKLLVPIAPTLLKLLPFVKTWRLVGFPENPDANAHRTFTEDPLTESKPMMMAGPSFACLTYCLDLVKEIPLLSTPFLTMHAKEDIMTDYASSEILMAQAASTDKTFLEPPPGSNHGLFAEEVSREWTRNAVRNWLKSRS